MKHTTTKTLLMMPWKQIKNIIKAIVGWPLSYPSLGSMTLDKDDVIIAREWIRRKNEWYVQDIVQNYELQFLQWNGSKYAFAFMGGRVALSACIYALDLQSGDEVIIPGYTCVVVPNAFQYAGIVPIYADIELGTYGLDIQDIKRKRTPKTKAIMLHHLYGLVCRDYPQILEYARENNLKIIEDCSHSTGAVFNGKKVGNEGDVAFYSSEQSKVFTTIQGGIAVTNNNLYAKRLKKYYETASLPDEKWIKNQLYNVILNYYQYKHSKKWFLEDIAEILYGRYRLISTTREEECGICPSYYGKRMPAPIAAIGINQLKKIDAYNQLRRINAKCWEIWCLQHGYSIPYVLEGSIPVYLRYPVLVEKEKKQNRRWATRELKIDLGVWFKTNIHPAKRSVINCPNSDYAVSHCVNFPTLLK